LSILALVDRTWNVRAQSPHSNTISVQWPKYPVPDAKSGQKVTKYIAVCISNVDPKNISAGTTDGDSTRVEVVNLMSNSNYTVQVLTFLGNSSISNVTIHNETIRASQKVIVRTKKQGKQKLNLS
jgi:hypothetical protein